MYYLCSYLTSNNKERGFYDFKMNINSVFNLQFDIANILFTGTYTNDNEHNNYAREIIIRQSYIASSIYLPVPKSSTVRIKIYSHTHYRKSTESKTTWIFF